MLGAGGYVAGPMVLAARMRGIPCALTEADAHLGLANRLAAPLADRVFLAFPSRRDGDRSTGRRPADPRGVAAAPARRGARRVRPRAGRARSCSSSAARSARALLNELARRRLGASRARPCSTSAASATIPSCATASRAPDYILRPFIDEIGLAYGAADIVLARAGGSVWELAAAGLPAVLVPGEFATGAHQEKNAALVRATPAARSSCRRRTLRTAPRVVEELLADPSRLEAMAAAMRAAAQAGRRRGDRR